MSGTDYIKKNIGKSWLLFMAIVLWIIPHFLGLYTIYVYSLLLIYLIASYGLNLIMGYAGQISLATASFMGIGAYSVALLTIKSCSFWIALPIGALLSFLIGLALGFPSLKVKHHYLAMVTIGFNFIVYKILMNEHEITGGPYGILNIARPKLGPINFSSDLGYAHLIVIITMIMIVVMYWMLNTQWGRAFKMIRENEVRAQILGVDLRAYKLIAFAIGSAYAGVAGGLLSPLLGYIEPTLFELMISFDFLLIVLIGGRGRFEGPLIGTSMVIILPEVLRITKELNLVVYSLAALIILLIAPAGGAGLWDWLYKSVTGKKSPSLTK